MKNKKSRYILFITASIATMTASNIYAATRNPFVAQLPLPEQPVGQKETVKTSPKEEPVSGSAILGEKNLPALQITGLVWNSKRPQAIINGQVVGIGEMIGEVKIVSIRSDGVDILFQDKIFTITP